MLAIQIFPFLDSMALLLFVISFTTNLNDWMCSVVRFFSWQIPCDGIPELLSVYENTLCVTIINPETKLWVSHT